MPAQRRSKSKKGDAAGPAIRLRYVADEPGISRQRRGRGFSYADAEGRRVTDRATLARIRALAVPPNWQGVWICPDEAGHIQATGRDARGRKQYRYHARWSDLRNRTKFERLAELGAALPRLRRRVNAALAGRDLSRERVLAAVVSLLDSTFARVGNREYRDANGSFGLTTLENRHARARGGKLRLDFRGKSGVRHELEIEDPRVARVVQRCQGLRGQALFQFVDEAGEIQRIDSHHVNDWLADVTGRETTAKEFRTWHGSVQALGQYLAKSPPASETEAKSVEVAVVDDVASRLGNTRAVCRKHYIHPELFDDFRSGALHRLLEDGPARRMRGLSVHETRLLGWLGSREASAAGRTPAEDLPRAS